MSNQKGYIVQFDKPVIVEDISEIIIKNGKNTNQIYEIMDCVLAKKQSDDKVYYIGSIIAKDGINHKISFYDGTIIKDVNFTNNDIYKLPKTYCQNMHSFYKNFDEKHQYKKKLDKQLF